MAGDVEAAEQRLSALEGVLDAVARRDLGLITEIGNDSPDVVNALKSEWLARYPEGTAGWDRLKALAEEKNGHMARLALRIKSFSAVSLSRHAFTLTPLRSRNL